MINNFPIGIDGTRSNQLHRRQGRERSGNPGNVYFRARASKVAIGHGLMPQALFCQINRGLAVCFVREDVQS